MIIVTGLIIIDPSTRRVIREVAAAKSITDLGYEFFIRSASDPAGRPSVINTVGIGWGPGSTAPFSPDQTALQGANTSLKIAGWSFDPRTDKRTCTFSALWGIGEPVAQLVLIGELGLFTASGIMVDRTPITPTPKYPQHEAVVHCVVSFAESETGFTLT